MSTRRTRQELIEQGVLKEVPDNGECLCDASGLSARRCLTAAAPRLTPTQDSAVSPQCTMGGTLAPEPAG